MSHSTTNTSYLTEAEIYSRDLKEYFEEHLMAKQYVEMVDFPTGTELIIPSIGQAEIRDYSEDQGIKYSMLDTGEFRFTITEYVSSGYSITDKLRQDAYMADKLVSSFEPKMRRALEERMEADILKVIPDNQTAGNANTINGGDHRFIGAGTNDTISVEDFAYANFVFNKANVPVSGRVAILDPSCEYQIATLTNLVNVSNNKAFEGVVREGVSDSMRFLFNIYGFDVYVSNFLKQGISETIGSNSVTNGVANIFMGAAPDKKPIIGSMRQPPRVEGKRDIDFQTDRFVLTCRYGFDLYHPESVITCITDNTQVRA